MKIEIGKMYKTRNGEIVGPVYATGDADIAREWPFAYKRKDGWQVTVDHQGYQLAREGEKLYDLVEEHVVAAPVNDYKQDQGKPPMLDALVPFYPALRALAAMMNDMKAKHRLEGAKDPFNEWRQLPNAKARLMNAAGGHLLQGPWKINEKDGDHLHAVHALFGLLAGITIHVEETKPATKTAWVVWDPVTEDYCLGVGEGTTPNFRDAMRYEHRVNAESHATFAPRWQVKQVIV